jgi:hypothetical protein
VPVTLRPFQSILLSEATTLNFLFSIPVFLIISQS